MIIGLAGRAGSGKNTVADIVCALCEGMRQASFADPLRWIAADLYGIHPHQMEDRALKEQVIPEWGLSPRQILQRLGTEVGRQIHADTWTRYLERRIRRHPGTDWTITDVRMPNEAELVRRHGGVIWWVARAESGSQTGGGHVTERAIGPDDCDSQIANDGTIEQLRSRVAAQLLREFETAYIA